MLITPPTAKNFSPSVVIYHTDCSDGFAAAYAARHYDKQNNPIRLIPYSHKDKIAEGLEDENIVFIDCCYKRSDLLKIKDINEVLVLDHHERTEEDCGDLDFVHINQQISGARLAWNFFFPDQSIPIQFVHIEDRDLFKFKNISTENFCAALDSYPMTFESWNEHFPIYLPEHQYIAHITDGITILRYLNTTVRQFAQNKNFCKFLGYNIVWCNATFPIHSNVGNFLKESHPECDFSICVGIENTNTIYLSFRSFSVNVNDIAKKFGGGGHKLAAGCRINFDQFAELFKKQ